MTTIWPPGLIASPAPSPEGGRRTHVNVADLVARAGAEHAGSPAVIEAATGRMATWGEVEQRVATTAGALRARGVSTGAPVAIVIGNSCGFAVAYWATLRAGAVAVPVNPAYTPPEIAHLLADSGAVTALVQPDLAGTVHAAAARAASTVRIEEVGAGGLESTDTLGTSPPDATLAILCYTSGTTGRPKGARLTHANLLANLEAFSSLPRLCLTQADVLLGVLPFFHVFGLNVVQSAAARHGACVLAMERFTPHGSLQVMARHGVTVAYGAPPVFAAWNAVSDEQRPRLPALHAAMSGADALPVPTWTHFADRFGIEILEGYGLTETSPVLASNAVAPETRPGTVGHALPGVSLRTVDPTGQGLPAGEVGEILAAGPNVFAGYHGQPEATAQVCRDGWFHTGDLGSFDVEGYLTIAGRLKHLVIVSGFNVYPREVEDALTQHPGVAEAAVVGLPDPRTGERVRAVVVARAGWDLDADVLLAHCRTRLARYKLPREVVLVDALPRLPAGKVDRRALGNLTV